MKIKTISKKRVNQLFNNLIELNKEAYNASGFVSPGGFVSNDDGEVIFIPFIDSEGNELDVVDAIDNGILNAIYQKRFYNLIEYVVCFTSSTVSLDPETGLPQPPKQEETTSEILNLIMGVHNCEYYRAYHIPSFQLIEEQKNKKPTIITRDLADITIPYFEMFNPNMLEQNIVERKNKIEINNRVTGSRHSPDNPIERLGLNLEI